MSNKKQIHFIGIGGTAMASLAKAFAAAGFKVTGSEPHQIFPPMSIYLKQNKVKYYFPFAPKKMGRPDEIVVGNAHYAAENVEVKWARDNNIELEHYPRLVEKYLIKSNSVVVAGTYAKTTTTAAVSWILDQSSKNPNYVLGGIPLNLKHGARLSKSNWSVVEGDEYPAASPWDFSPKFNYYSPKYLVLTSAEWDHMDIYKTKKNYLDVFKKLVASMPQDGLIVAKLEGENLQEVLKTVKCRIVYYTTNNIKILKHKNIKKTYLLNKVELKNEKTKFEVKCGNKIIGKFETRLLGEFNLENLLAAIALTRELKIYDKKIKEAIKSFKGVKRRLEIRARKNGVTIIDDFAHSPSKAAQAVVALKKYFPGQKIYVVFEPNRGGRSSKCLPGYKKVFADIEKVFIPKLTEYKKKVGVQDVSGKELAAYLKKQGQNAFYQPNNLKIMNNLLKLAKKDTVIAFLGSRDFGGLIEKIIKKL